MPDHKAKWFQCRQVTDIGHETHVCFSQNASKLMNLGQWIITNISSCRQRALSAIKLDNIMRGLDREDYQHFISWGEMSKTGVCGVGVRGGATV